ncbi:MAG: DUF2817 domain-containing protein [Actinomycetota bacterium]|nr:DUF2817 domain-containing protein [Actinomycetota bacterium]
MATVDGRRQRYRATPASTTSTPGRRASGTRPTTWVLSAAGAMVLAAALVRLTQLVPAWIEAAPAGTAPARGRPPAVATASPRARPRPALVERRLVIGRSVDGRSIFAFERGSPGSERPVLVIGAVHGNEAAGVAIADALLSRPPASRVDLWVVPDLNPDGVAADTRQNADGVDLNRNFPYAWTRLGRRGDQQYSGPAPLSEPESRAAASLISRLRPQVTIWFHQPLDVVDDSGGDIAVERRFARLVRLPLVRLRRYPGSAASWQDHELRTSTAFVVELPPRLTAGDVGRFVGAVMQLAEEQPAR